MYSDNHLLIFNKPAGWHSIPRDQQDESYYKQDDSKCLLSFAQRKKWGAGSNNDFLLPIHRIDQPCTGVLLFGKTTKAASRITTLWKDKGVVKDYLCVISSNRLPGLIQASSHCSDMQHGAESDDSIVYEHHNSISEYDDWYFLNGVMQASPVRRSRSVRIFPDLSRASSPSLTSSVPAGRPVHIYWKHVDLENGRSQNQNKYSLIRVQTTLGARHMVRALLAQIGDCPIVGDVRYHPSYSAPILPDQSVALHAYRVSLDPTLKLGSLDTFVFEAPIPSTWDTYFGIQNSDLIIPYGGKGNNEGHSASMN